MNTIHEETDVLVVGAGSAGLIAALQAARAGIRTTLVEAMGQVGGTITTFGVSAPALFCSKHKQVIAGIGWELVRDCKRLEGTPMPPFHIPRPNRPSYHVSLNPFVYAALAEERCLDAGIDLHLREFTTDVRDTGDAWEVDLAGKNIRRRIVARELIDCTGDADLVRLLGLPVERGEKRQPGTLELKLTPVDPAIIDEATLQQAYEAALADGRLQPGDFCYADRPFSTFAYGGGYNLVHVFEADSSTSALQTDANIRGRQAMLRLLRFIRSLPGCGHVTVEKMCTDTAIRETCRIVGETRVTKDDYLSGRVFDDAVAYSMYFIDEHTHEGTYHVFLDDHVVPTIPFGALIPKGSRRLLVAGRMIASDRLAQSALRVQCSCMAMGQAVGAAAALGVQRGVASRDVPIDAIRDLLRQHDAIVPPELREIPVDPLA